MYKKNILILSDSYNGYGAEHMLLWLGNMLSAHGYMVYACAIFDKEKNPEIAESVSFIGLDKKRPCAPLGLMCSYFVKSSLEISEICKHKKISLIITFKENPLCIAQIVKRITHVKHIHSERDDPYYRNTVAARLKMKLYKYVDWMVFQTEGAQHFFGKDIIEKSVIIPNPVNMPCEKWESSIAQKTIVNVGRLNIRFKRQDVLLRAFAKLNDRYNEWILCFYGDGVDREKLEQLSKFLKISDRVKFYGKVSDVNERLIKDGIFVLSSDTEGLPNALMEAMALGMPVISTDCSPGGARFLIENGVNGLLTERSSEDRLKDALILLIESDEMKLSLGRNARKSMEKYHPTIICNKWLDLLSLL